MSPAKHGKFTSQPETPLDAESEVTIDFSCGKRQRKVEGKGNPI